MIVAVISIGIAITIAQIVQYWYSNKRLVSKRVHGGSSTASMDEGVAAYGV